MRLLDSFTNITDQPVTIMVQVLTDVGSDNSTAVVEETSGNNVIDPSDRGFVTDEIANQTGGDSSVGYVYGDGVGLQPIAARPSLNSGKGPDEITVQFQLTLQPGETQRLLSYAFQNTTAAQGIADLTQFDDLLPTLSSRGLLAGISAAERAQIVNYAETLESGLQVTDGSGQTWQINTATGSISTVGNSAVFSTRVDLPTTPLSTFTTVESTVVSEAGQEVNLTLSSTSAVPGDARLTHSLMASPDQGYARYLVTITADPTAGFNLTGSELGLMARLGAGGIVGARDIATGSFSTTLDFTDSGLVYDDSTSGAGGTRPSLSVVWGDFTMGDALDGNDGVKLGTGELQTIYDDLNLGAGASASFLYFFATNPDAGLGFADVAMLSTPDFRDLAGLSAAEVARIINFDLDESDRLQTVAGFGAGDDVYAGNYWGELIEGAGGNDNLSGGGSDDVMRGGAGNDILDGGTGDDRLDGGEGTDTLIGGSGNDTLFVRGAGVVIVEGAGGGTADTVAASASFTLAADDHIERMQTTSSGGTTAINLTGNAMVQRIFGNAGVNVLSDGGGAGADTMTGLGGNDTYIVRNAATVIVENAGQGTADRVAAGVSFTLADDDDIEVLTTSSAGATTAINLTGNMLAQSITGNAGANVLDGRGGNDTITGGAGADDFVFSTALGAGNVDRIMDFAVGVDDIVLQASVFGAIGADLSASEFRVGAALDADDFILYDAVTGALTFDSNGDAAGGATQFATLATGLALTFNDFVIL